MKKIYPFAIFSYLVLKEFYYSDFQKLERKFKYLLQFATIRNAVVINTKAPFKFYFTPLEQKTISSIKYENSLRKMIYKNVIVKLFLSPSEGMKGAAMESIRYYGSN